MDATYRYPSKRQHPKYDFEISGEDINVVSLKRMCGSCKEFKIASDFVGDRNICAKCRKENQGKFKHNSKTYHYQRNYGISEEGVRGILREQMGLCANRACGKELSIDVKIGDKRKAYVDHCHSTGKVRGVLCVSCNNGLGFLEQKNKVLGLTEYLNKHST